MGWGRGSLLVACALAVGAVAAAPAADAALKPGEALTYIPHGFVHDVQPAALEELDSYGIGQALFPVKAFKKTGLLKLSKHERVSFARWVAATRAYDEAHGAAIVAVASIAGKVKASSLNLEDPAVRANMVAGVES